VTECPAHPGVEAVGTCSRCGRFYCAAEARIVDSQVFCGTCAERPEVDWLTHHYARLEGRRSGLVWFATFLGAVALFVGGSVIVVMIQLLGDVLRREAKLEDAQWAAGPLAIILWSFSAFLLQTGKRWALTLHLVTVVLVSLLAAFANGVREEQLFVGGTTLVMTGLFWAVLRMDVRTRLFFRLPVERSALRAHYERYGSNWQAASASRLSALSLFIPGLALISLGLAVWGLSRIDKRAVPPVGGLGSALGAVILSAMSCALWGFLVFH